MSLTFDFPGFHKQWDDQQGNSSSFDKTNKDETNRLQNLAADAWHDDLQELSGEAEDEQQEGTAAAAANQQHVPHKQQRQHQHQHAEVSARVSTFPSLCNTHDGQQTDAWGSPRKQQRTDLSSSPSGSSSAGASTAAGHVDHHQQQQQVPEAVLLLIVDLLDMRDMMAVACCCKAWHECLLQSNQDVWAQQEQHLLDNGWPWAPFRGAKLQQLPPSLGTTALLHLKSTLRLNKVGLQYYVMRKGYEFMLAGFEALWAALEHAQAAGAAAAGAGGAAAATFDRTHSIPSPGVTLPAATGAAAIQPTSSPIDNKQHIDQQQQQQRQSALAGGRQLQRLVDKLAQHSWELTYSGYTAALAARCDELAQQLRTAWQQQQQQRWLRTGPGCAGSSTSVPISQPAAAATALVVGEGVRSNAQTAAAAAAAAAAALPAAVLADCAGGILSDIESVSGGLGAGELLSGEPELLLAATRRGPRPDASISLWAHLLPVWERYRRWLDLVTARCGLLGARVAAARQLAEPSSRGPPNAALLPHLRNKGLLLFRGHVLLAYGLRRPLQEAALWLAAAASADPSAWRAGGGCSEADLELLLRVRKLLTELDVADGQDEDVGQHTHGKFRRCFGALLTKQRRNRCLPASAW